MNNNYRYYSYSSYSIRLNKIYISKLALTLVYLYNIYQKIYFGFIKVKFIICTNMQLTLLISDKIILLYLYLFTYVIKFNLQMNSFHFHHFSDILFLYNFYYYIPDYFVRLILLFYFCY